MVRVHRCPWRDALDNFDPQNHARHVAEFFRIAGAVIGDETQYLCGPEILILEQIDEEDPSGLIYKHLDLEENATILTKDEKIIANETVRSLW